MIRERLVWLMLLFLCRLLLLMICLPLTYRDWGLLLTSLFFTMGLSYQPRLRLRLQRRYVYVANFLWDSHIRFSQLSCLIKLRASFFFCFDNRYCAIVFILWHKCVYVANLLHFPVRVQYSYDLVMVYRLLIIVFGR